MQELAQGFVRCSRSIAIHTMPRSFTPASNTWTRFRVLQLGEDDGLHLHAGARVVFAQVLHLQALERDDTSVAS